LNPELKAHGTLRLKLKHDEVVSSFAFKFSLRRYTVARRAGLTVHFLNAPGHFVCMVGQFRPTVSKPVLKAPMVSALEAKI